MSATAASPIRSTIAVTITLAIAATAVYWLPQAGGALQSDVTWIYRIQVAPAGSLPPVPDGLRLFSGAPMGWIEACQAHFAAFRRFNCGDVALWRASAILAGESGRAWLAIALAFDVAALVFVELALRVLGLAWPLRLVAVVGLFIMPAEIWVTAVTSESRVLLAFAMALAAAAAGRPWLAAIAMAVMVSFKEPAFVWWPLVMAISFTRPTSGRPSAPRYRSLVPHAIVAGLLFAAFVAAWLLLEARNDYPFLLRIPYPEPVAFVVQAMSGILPPILTSVPGAVGASLATCLLVFAIHAAGRWGTLRAEAERRDTYLPVLAAVIGLMGHLAVHWLTRRTIGEGRYAVPANLGMVMLLAAALVPVVSTAPKWSRRAAGAVIAAAALASACFWSNDLLALAVVAGGAGILLGILFVMIRGAADRTNIGLGAALGLVVSLAVLPAIDERLDRAGAEVTNSRDFRETADGLLAALPKGSLVILKTSDALMIETAWALQAELLFGKRGDVALRLDPGDTSFYDKEDGLVRAANESFNRNRPTVAEAARAGRPIFELTLDRAGASQSRPRPMLEPSGALLLVLRDPARYYNVLHVDWRVGYLNATLQPAPAGKVDKVTP